MFVFPFYTETLLFHMNGSTTLYIIMINNVQTVKPHADILLLGDFNIF